MVLRYKRENTDLVLSNNQQHFHSLNLATNKAREEKCLFLSLFPFCIKYDPINNRCALETKMHSVSFLIYSSAR